MITNVTYIKHSCYLVELTDAYLLFDYYEGELPPLSKEKPLYVFASHFHQDHFSFHLFQELASYTKVTYLLSKDIKRKYNKGYFTRNGVTEEQYAQIQFLSHDVSLELPTLLVRTLQSTDSGVAFLLQGKEETIYHAGDLNWWTWEGETREEYQAMTQAFQKEIAKMEGMHINLAFLPLDARQNRTFHLGFDYFMRHVEVDQVYPMHFFDNYTVIPKLRAMDCSAPYRQKIHDPFPME
ncbi:MBL fold metallo-hydrolase [Anaerosporobacter faecicola]|uniref:MBL fold metallo-hydrolase n=1 Tax=Anaerosporobacter faecicola TaxID=2718714 RepID=UPI00143C9C0E|nr:MBL fold metallo-hydrolase [Anaerosporobacter faecicola]